MANNSPGPIIFEGRVLPEHRHVTIPAVDGIRYVDPAGLDAEIDVLVCEGRVIVTCSPIQGQPDIGLCLARCYETVSTLVDLYAFGKGWALSVILDYLITSDRRRPIALSETSVQPLNTALLCDEDLRVLWPIVMKNFSLKFAIRDLIMSVGTLNYSAIAAARAVESIRAAIASAAASDKAHGSTCVLSSE